MAVYHVWTLPKNRDTLRHKISLVAETAWTVAEVCRQDGISEGTYDCWKARYGGLEVSQLRQLRQLYEENGRLKQIVADLTLDNRALKMAATKR